MRGAVLMGRSAYLLPRADERIRRQVDFLAAQLMYQRTESEDFDDLMLLRELDSRGRQPGAIVRELSEALDYLRTLADESDG